jgi:hypothetical protein
MSTFLELVQALHRESGSTGVQPSTVVNQSGERLRLLKYVADADYEIQTYWRDWKFLRDMTSFNETTVSAQQDITKPSTLKSWDFGTLRIDGELIDVVEYEDVRGEVFNTTDYSQPSRIIVLPNNNLRLDPIPDGAYTFTGDFFIKPTRMSANLDESLIPEEYRMSVILGLALMKYADSENAGEIYNKGLRLYESNIVGLEDSQLPSNNQARTTSSGNVIEVIAE